MNTLKTIIGSLILMSSFAHAEEGILDKAKSGAVELWEKTKTTSAEVVEDVSEKTSGLGEKTSEIGNEVSKNAKKTGVVVWDKMKEIGSATADGARNGASKIREIVSEDCKEDSALCYKDKE